MSPSQQSLSLFSMGKSFRGRFLQIESDVGVIGRNVLNHVRLAFDGPALRLARSCVPKARRPKQTTMGPGSIFFKPLRTLSPLMSDHLRCAERFLQSCSFRCAASSREAMSRPASRPVYHFTPPKNFINDPNGLVFLDGEYHLFYQHNPEGDRWGHMSWGHAVSRDLVRWQHLPIALREENGIMIFSGSAVFDAKNTSGLGSKDAPPLIAVYTGDGHKKQTQNLASSTDRGRTWTKFAGKPRPRPDSNSFRDPKVFWHKPTGRWIMATVLADERKVRLWGSADLKAGRN